MSAPSICSCETRICATATGSVASTTMSFCVHVSWTSPGLQREVIVRRREVRRDGRSGRDAHEADHIGLDIAALRTDRAVRDREALAVRLDGEQLLFEVIEAARATARRRRGGVLVERRAGELGAGEDGDRSIGDDGGTREVARQTVGLEVEHVERAERDGDLPVLRHGGEARAGHGGGRRLDLHRSARFDTDDGDVGTARGKTGDRERVSGRIRKNAVHLAEAVLRNEERAVVRERLRERVQLIRDDGRAARDAERARREHGAGSFVVAEQAAVDLARRHRDRLDLPRRNENVLHRGELGRLARVGVVLLDHDVGRLRARVRDDDAPGCAGRVVREVFLVVEIDGPELAADVRGGGRDGVAARLARAADARLLGAVAVAELLRARVALGGALVNVLADANASVDAGLRRADRVRRDDGAAVRRSVVEAVAIRRARTARHREDDGRHEDPKLGRTGVHRSFLAELRPTDERGCHVRERCPPTLPPSRPRPRAAPPRRRGAGAGAVALRRRSR